MKDRLVFEKTSCEIVDGSTSCDRCDLAKLFPGTDNCKVFGCKTNENYKLIVGEKKPVLSTYAHNKARYIILNSSCVFIHLSIVDLEELESERNMLCKWLEENKPENWQTCTKENTKVGDEIREITSKYTEYGLYNVCMFLENNSNFDCVIDVSEKLEATKRQKPSRLSSYEINIAEMQANVKSQKTI